jgi:hypothetical protein
MSKTEPYLKLEHEIITTCINAEWAYPAIANILSAANFSIPNNARIWQCITDLWPDDVSFYSIRKHSQKNYPHWPVPIMLESNYLVSTKTILINKSFVLLEIDMRNKFSKLLFDIYTTWCNGDGESNKGMLMECIETIRTTDADVLETIELMCAWLEKQSLAEKFLSPIIEFEKSIDKKVFDIKRVNQIERLLERLIEMGDGTWNSKNIVSAQHLSECLTALFIGKEITIEQQQQIIKLKKSLIGA